MLCSNMFAIQQKIMLYTSSTSESQSSESGLPIARSLAGRDFLQLHLLTACLLVWSVVGRRSSESEFLARHTIATP